LDTAKAVLRPWRWLRNRPAIKALVLFSPPTDSIDQALLRQQEYLLRVRDGLEPQAIELALKPLGDALAKVKKGQDDRWRQSAWPTSRASPNMRR